MRAPEHAISATVLIAAAEPNPVLNQQRPRGGAPIRMISLNDDHDERAWGPDALMIEHRSLGELRRVDRR